ncbi:MAG: choice-of-anchor J domain-containing protein, partial [Phycisphaerales bacterium]
DCDQISVVTQCVPPGTYWAFVSHQTYYDAPCSPFSDYVATLTATSCYLPPGACCAIDGTCTEVPELNCGGIWLGEGTTCDPDPCPEMADFCEDAIPVGVPSVTFGTTQGATTDSGYPSPCGSASITSPGVWYSVIGTGNTMTADLCNGTATYDSKLTVYCWGCDATVCVDGNDDYCGLQSQVTWCSQPGAEYLILVHGYGGATGVFELTITDDGVPCTDAVGCLPTGACCLDNAACIVVEEYLCDAQGGAYQGDDTDCGGLLAGEEKFDCNEHVIGALDSSSPTWNRVFGSSVDLTCNANVYDSSANGQYYAAIPIATTVSELLEAEFLQGGTTIGDTVLTLYCDPFDPANPMDNVIAYDDDGGYSLLSGFYASDGIFLDAGVQYWLVLSTFSAGVTGNYDFCLGGHFFVGGGGPGACCLPDGTCGDGYESDACGAAGGTFMGGGSECATVECPELVGACCLPVGTIADCIVTTETCCDYAEGDFLYGVGNCGEATVEVLSEEFEGSFPPAGWTVVDNAGSGVIWQSNADLGIGNWTGCTGNSAVASSDEFGSAPYDTWLISPVLDLSGGINPTLNCMVNFQNFAGYDWFYIDVSYDAGMNWATLLAWNEDHGSFHNAPGEMVTLGLGAGTATTQVRFGYVDPVSHWNWEVSVDCITITLDVSGDNPCPLYPRMDIKPGSCPNSFNRGSNGVLPVAVLGDADFDATLVDISTLHIFRADGVGGSIGPNEGPPGPHTTYEDVGTPYDGELCGCHDMNGDGVMDLVMKFKTADLVAALQMDEFEPGALVELVVGGNMLDGKEFHAEDCVRLVPPGTPPGQLVVTSLVPGAWIQSNPLDLQLDGGGFTDFERTFPVGTVVTLTAPDSVNGRPFKRWIVDGVLYPAGVNTIQVPIDEGLNSVELEVKWREPNIPPRENAGPDRRVEF